MREDSIKMVVKCAINQRDIGLRIILKEFAELKYQYRLTAVPLARSFAKQRSIMAMAQQKWMLPQQLVDYLKNARIRLVFHRQSIWLERKENENKKPTFFLHMKTKHGEPSCYLRLRKKPKYYEDLEKLSKAAGNGFDSNDVLGQVELIQDPKYGWVNAHITLRLPRPEEYEPAGWIGVDLGWVNLATSVFYDGKQVRQRDVEFHERDFKTRILQLKYLMKEAQRKGRSIKKWRHSLVNARKNAVGKIAKQLKEKALKLKAGIVMEKLTIQSNTKRWLIPRYNLKCAVKVLCERNGIPFREVPAPYTSTTCNNCGHSEKENRIGKLFKCLKCGYEANADFNAAINIAKRGIHAWQSRACKGTGASQRASHTPVLGDVATPSSESCKIKAYSDDRNTEITIGERLQ